MNNRTVIDNTVDNFTRIGTRFQVVITSGSRIILVLVVMLAVFYAGNQFYGCLAELDWKVGHTGRRPETRSGAEQPGPRPLPEAAQPSLPLSLRILLGTS